MSTEAISCDRNELIKAIVSRIENLEEQKKAIAEDTKDIYAEAKNKGLDKKALKAVLKIRKQGVDETRELQDVVDVYLHALGMPGLSSEEDRAPIQRAA